MTPWGEPTPTGPAAPAAPDRLSGGTAIIDTLAVELDPLVRQFRQCDLSSLQPYRQYLTTQTDDGQVVPPYVPYVGPSYGQHRVLVYATAQNLPRSTPRKADHELDLYKANPAGAVLRLYHGWSTGDTAAHGMSGYETVPIEPYWSAVLPALVGMFLYTRHGHRLRNLQEVHRMLAVTNYYKFSLNDGRRDLNPETPGRRLPDAQAYWDLNDRPVAEELAALRPHLVLAQRGRKVSILRARGLEVVEFSDPAWVLRGHGGCLGPNGTWAPLIREVTDGGATDLAEAYSSEASGQYACRQGEVRDFLLWYCRCWAASS